LVLRQSILAFIGNLCGDPQLRALIAGNIQGILDEVCRGLENGAKAKP
jgi:hypothetical protein